MEHVFVGTMPELAAVIGGDPVLMEALKPITPAASAEEKANENAWVVDRGEQKYYIGILSSVINNSPANFNSQNLLFFTRDRRICLSAWIAVRDIGHSEEIKTFNGSGPEDASPETLDEARFAEWSNVTIAGISPQVAHGLEKEVAEYLSGREGARTVVRHWETRNPDADAAARVAELSAVRALAAAPSRGIFGAEYESNRRLFVRMESVLADHGRIDMDKLIPVMREIRAKIEGGILTDDDYKFYMLLKQIMPLDGV